jgi:AcrR family transcriptional regulator
MLSVAQAVFSRRGYHQASMDEIADGADISKPMVYAYYGSKEGLYRACIERARRGLLAAIDEAVAGEQAPDQQLWLGIVAFFRFVEDNREAWAMLYREASIEGGPFAEEVEHMRNEQARLLSQLLGEAAMAEGVQPSSLQATEPLAYALVGAGQSLASWWLEHPSESKETVALHLMNLVWMGLGNLVRGSVWSP